MDELDIGVSYDRLARRYAELFTDQLDEQPIDRALLAAFAEMVLAGGSPSVVDLGCGPGHVTAHLGALGLAVSGLDASPEMVGIACDRRPDLDFRVGDLRATPYANASFGGALSRYSTIHLAEDDMAGVAAEFARLLVPGGLLLMSFHGAWTREGHGEPFDHAVATGYRRHPEVVSKLLQDAGLAEELRNVQQPGPDERFDQVTLLARRAHT